jgi:hypothetical protein
MRPSVDRIARDRWTLLGLTTGLTLFAGGAIAGDGDGPELSSPSEMPVLISKPATTTPAPAAVRPSTARLPGRPMLAIPGITTPAARPSIPIDAPKTTPGPAVGEPALDAPIEMRPFPEALAGQPGLSPSQSNFPLILDPGPIDELPPPGGATTRSNPPSRKPTSPPQPVPTPARRPRLFGFFSGPAPSTAASSDPAGSKPIIPGRAMVDDEPAAESALKKRIERQAREVVGNRARSVEVKLDGKEAVVHVSGVKFLQKRAIRKQLEGIPALSGLRSTIEVGD